MNPLRAENQELLLEPVAISEAPSGVEHGVSLRNRFERLLTGIEIIADWLTVVLILNVAYIAYHAFNLGRRVHYNFATITYVSCAVAALYVILLDRDGAYRPGSSLLRIKETERSLRVTVQTFLLILPVTLFSSHLLSRWFLTI